MTSPTEGGKSASFKAALGALGRVREFVESEVDNRSYAGGSMTDYENEAQEALDELDAAVAALRDQHADALHEIMAALYKAWPHAEDMGDGTHLGIIGLIEQLTDERNALLEALRRNRAALDLIDPDRPLQYATTMDLMRKDMDAAILQATGGEDGR